MRRAPNRRGTDIYCSSQSNVLLQVPFEATERKAANVLGHRGVFKWLKELPGVLLQN